MARPGRLRGLVEAEVVEEVGAWWCQDPEP